MFWARLVFFVFFVAAFDVSAQIVIDFDVLDSVGEQEPETVKPAKKVAPKTKKQPQKQQQKQPEKTDKYQVVESEKQDEHDKLKPRSNPVPVVKVISLDVKKEKPETQKKTSVPAVKKAQKPVKPQPPEKAKKPTVAVVEKTSAAVAETVKETTPEPEKPTVAVVEKTPVAVEETVKETTSEPEKPAVAVVEKTSVDVPETVEPVKEDVVVSETIAETEPAPEKTTASDKIIQARDAVEKILSRVMQKNAEEKKALETVQENTEATPSDVFAVPEDYSAAQRSAFLAEKLPSEAAGIRTLTKKTLLHDVILFEKDVIDFTAESQKKAADLATFLKENPAKRVIVFTYAAPSSIDAGRERQLTLRRALALRSFLAQSGVRTVRIEIRSQGKKGAGENYPDRAEILVYDR